MKTKTPLLVILTLLATLLIGDPATAHQTDKTAERLLRAAEGLQYPGSEADSTWAYVSYPNEKDLPSAERFGEISGCFTPSGDPGVTTRQDFDATLDRLGTVGPWMDQGQKKSARGFRKLQRLFHREYGQDVAVYRCETGGPEVYLYFVGLGEDGFVGLKTTSIET